MKGYLHSRAIFNRDRSYRYMLSRRWEEQPSRSMVVIGLNPSTADESTDDPTIRRCVGFAKREKCGELIMLNLFTLCSTDPMALWRHIDPVGRENDETIRRFGWTDAILVAAWGAVNGSRAHAEALRERVRVVREILPVGLRCLGMTQSKAPRHPLYVARCTALVPWPEERIADA